MIYIHSLYTSCLSMQYYSIQTIAVAPYDYYEADNAIYPTCPPLLQVQLEQYNKSAFDAATKNISLSMNTHPGKCKLGNERKGGMMK